MISRTALLTVTLLALSMTSAFAQSRPYRGLFASGVGTNSQSLTLTTSAGTGYDTNVVVGDDRISAAPSRAGGRSTVGTAATALAYNLNGKRLTFGASVDTAVSYYPVLDNPFIITRAASIGASFAASKSTELYANESLSYQPYYTLASFPVIENQPLGQPILNDQNQSANIENHLTSLASAGVRHNLSRRATLSFAYSDYRSRSASENRNTSYHSATGRYSVSLTKGLTARMGYGYSWADYSGNDNLSRVESHMIDAGVDFTRALSLSRRLTFSFGTGSTIFNYSGQSNLVFTGNAHLTREVGRTWSAELAFVRSANIEETYRQPVVSDSLIASYGGLFSRKLHFQSSAGMTRGTVGFVNTNSYRAMFADARLSKDLTRSLAVTINYAYYRYGFDQDFDFAGLRDRMDRHSVRVYLSFWLPLIERKGTVDAAR